MNKMSIRDVDVQNKRVLMRVDFNVPLNDEGRITNDARIRKALPTIQYVVEHGGKLILMSHLGRPKGKRVPSMSLRPVADRLSELLGKPVQFADDCVGASVEKAVAALQPGDVLLLENLRFHIEEEKNDPDFARKLAALGDLYVNDAFSAAHRAHASTEGVTHFISPCVAGFLMEEEIKYLAKAMESPVRPFVAIIGGVKISGKIDAIQNLLGKVDVLLIGGGMAFTFYKAQGLEIGKSILEADKVDLAKEILKSAREKEVEFLLPVDVLIANKVDPAAATKTVSVENIPNDWTGVDIGEKTIALFSEKIHSAKTVVWNGPMGIFEMEPFARGTFAIAEALAQATEQGATTIVGGGDSVAAVSKAGLEDKITHILTGGGASLKMLSGYKLPGLEALTDKD